MRLPVFEYYPSGTSRINPFTATSFLRRVRRSHKFRFTLSSATRIQLSYNSRGFYWSPGEKERKRINEVLNCSPKRNSFPVRRWFITPETSLPVGRRKKFTRHPRLILVEFNFRRHRDRWSLRVPRRKRMSWSVQDPENFNVESNILLACLRETTRIMLI